MPPKAKAAASGDANDAQRHRDAMTIFDSLFHINSTVVVNVAEIAERTGEKANTIAKRFSLIRQRYPEIKVRTTTVGGVADGTDGPVPATPKARKTSAAKPKTPKKVAIQAEDEEQDDHQDQDVIDTAQPYNGAEDDEAMATVPATPKASLTDTNLADDEQSAKKPKTKAPVTKITKPKANTKRKRDDDNDNSSAGEPKVKKASKVKALTKVKQEDGESNGEDGKQKNLPPKKRAESNNGVHQSDKTASKQIREEDLALDVVEKWADKSRKAPMSKSPQKPMTEKIAEQPVEDSAPEEDISGKEAIDPNAPASTSTSI